MNGWEIRTIVLNRITGFSKIMGTLKNSVFLANKPTACRAKRQPAMNANGRKCFTTLIYP
jgi:hypothetical protein